MRMPDGSATLAPALTGRILVIDDEERIVHSFSLDVLLARVRGRLRAASRPHPVELVVGSTTLILEQKRDDARRQRRRDVVVLELLNEDRRRRGDGSRTAARR